MSPENAHPSKAEQGADCCLGAEHNRRDVSPAEVMFTYIFTNLSLWLRGHKSESPEKLGQIQNMQKHRNSFFKKCTKWSLYLNFIFLKEEISREKSTSCWNQCFFLGYNYNKSFETSAKIIQVILPAPLFEARSLVKPPTHLH